MNRRMQAPSPSVSFTTFALRVIEWLALSVVVRVGWEIGGKLWAKI